jgi:hypothetical protein
MLIIRGATAHVGWIFRQTGPDTKAAVCLTDQFTIAYPAAPSVAWGQLLVQIVAHSVTIGGAFADAYWVGV